MNTHSPGRLFRQAVQQHNPLQIVGTVNAYSAILAEKSGHQAIYLSGGGVAACSLGIPDLGISTLHDVLQDTFRITAASSLPLLVDVDTGWGGSFNIARAIREVERAGAAAVHLEDQVMQKRCGHRPNKAIVSSDEMVDRIKSAVDARHDSDFVIMARTDSLATEGMSAAIERACACVEAGADMIFPEAIQTLDEYRQFVDAVKVPVLANITEFGQTPLFNRDELASAGVKMALYPLSAFRAASLATLTVYQEILQHGSQQACIDSMQTRASLYEYLGYHTFEQHLDKLFEGEKHD